MINEQLLEDLGFRYHGTLYGGRGFIKDLQTPAETSVLVTFDCYYCKRDNVPFCVWISGGGFIPTDIRLEHIKTEEQLKLLWLALTGEPLPAPKHYLIISRFKGDAIGCTTDRAGLSGEDRESLFKEFPKEQCLFCNEVKE